MPGSSKPSLKCEGVGHFSDFHVQPSSGGHEGGRCDKGSKITYCCLPSGCPRIASDPIYLQDGYRTGKVVKVFCDNVGCTEGEWMHLDCFQEWEEKVLTYVSTCGRARSWTDKQKHQNIWTKKGYDLAFKACGCKCGKGHLRCDLDFMAEMEKNDEKKGLKKSRKKERHPSGLDIKVQPRTHRLSQSSPSSSPPGFKGMMPLSPDGFFSPKKKTKQMEFFADVEQAAAGNIFRHRKDLDVFNALPHDVRNPYHIKMEDEGPYGNDENRCFILTTLSAENRTSVECAVCKSQLTIYDKYPLIDGTFFLSPQSYDFGIQVTFNRRSLFLNAVCFRCLNGIRSTLSCRDCNVRWNGSMLVIGSMYTYDIFAAMPCCVGRLGCNRCSRPVLDPASPLKFFSDYSRLQTCPHCGAEEYHITKPLDDIFMMKRCQLSELN